MFKCMSCGLQEQLDTKYISLGVINVFDFILIECRVLTDTLVFGICK